MADTPVPNVREFFMVEENPRVHGKTRGPVIQRKAPSIHAAYVWRVTQACVVCHYLYPMRVLNE